LIIEKIFNLRIGFSLGFLWFMQSEGVLTENFLQGTRREGQMSWEGKEGGGGEGGWRRREGEVGGIRDAIKVMVFSRVALECQHCCSWWQSCMGVVTGAPLTHMADKLVLKIFPVMYQRSFVSYSKYIMETGTKFIVLLSSRSSVLLKRSLKTTSDLN
jgi:hypothetical protein